MPIQKISMIASDPITNLCTRALNGVTSNAEVKKSAEQAYGAWLGYYNTNCKKCGWDKPGMCGVLWCGVWGLLTMELHCRSETYTTSVLLLREAVNLTTIEN